MNTDDLETLYSGNKNFREYVNKFSKSEHLSTEEALKRIMVMNYGRYIKEEKVKKIRIMLDNSAIAPNRAHADDAGLDLMTPKDVIIPPKGAAIINTGVHIEIPRGYVGMLKSKSGLNVKKNLISEGVIDAGYTGSIVVKLYNLGEKEQVLKRGQKITQLVILPTITPKLVFTDRLEDTERGCNGFGSSGD